MLYHYEVDAEIASKTRRGWSLMTHSTILGVGSPAQRDEDAASPSAVPANVPMAVDHYRKAFDASKLRLHHLAEPSDATRLLRRAVDAAEMSTASIAGATGLSRATVKYARAGRFNTTFSNYLKILGALGARIYIGIPREPR
jgi:DNA-binding phage protein